MTQNTGLPDPELLQRALDRERKARQRAEHLLEEKSRELFNANQLLTDQVDALAKAQAQLVQSEKLASVGQLAAGVAHEINNPIAYVTSNVSTLDEYTRVFLQAIAIFDDVSSADIQQNPTALQQLLADYEKLRSEEDFAFLIDDCQDLLSESAEGLQRVKDIVQDLKTFVRLDEMETQETDINSCIESTLKVLPKELTHDRKIQTSLQPLPRILGHPGKLNQVFLNLIVNALQSIEGKGCVTISTGTANDQITIDVADNGAGIPTEHLNSIFEPFYTTKPVGTGTGLGLSVSLGIVEDHGGTIEVISEAGVGTKFSISLPIGRQS